jgi:hypothetical protein
MTTTKIPDTRSLVFGICSGTAPWGRNVEPIWFEIFFVGFDLQIERTLLFSGSELALISQGEDQNVFEKGYRRRRTRGAWPL